MNTSGKGAKAAGRAVAVKDNARGGEDKVKLPISASETFGLLTIANELFHYRHRTGEKKSPSFNMTLCVSGLHDTVLTRDST